jgi:hypothetical protein
MAAEDPEAAIGEGHSGLQATVEAISALIHHKENRERLRPRPARRLPNPVSGSLASGSRQRWWWPAS